jgi:hypothetical protein
MRIRRASGFGVRDFGFGIPGAGIAAGSGYGAFRARGFDGRLTGASAFVVVRGVLGDGGVDEVGFFSAAIGFVRQKTQCSRQGPEQ